MDYKITDVHINEYISGELTGNDLIEFEKLLAKDKNLQQQIKVHQQIDTVLSDNYFEKNRFNEADYKSEKERLNPIFKKMKEEFFVEEKTDEGKKIRNNEINLIKAEKNTPKNTPIIRKLLPFVTLAAAAALLLFVFNPFVNNMSPTQLADQYFEAQTVNNIRGELDNENLQKTPRELLAQGSEQYEAGRMGEAIQTFQQVAANSSETFTDAANWYLALCYLKQNQPENAKPLLIKLQTSKNYHVDAKDILKQLE